MAFAKGVYKPYNPEKYRGVRQPEPVYRSSWELEFMKVLDLSDEIIAWDSEAFAIPYFNPIKQRQSLYVPDLFIVQIIDGNPVSKLIEIKPISQAFQEYARNEKDAADQMVNDAKWAAAIEWCERRSGAEGMPVLFETMTEADMFAGGKAIIPKGHTVRPMRLHGRTAKKKMTPGKAAGPKSIMSVLQGKATRQAGMFRTGRVSTVKASKVGKVRKIGRVRRARSL